MAFSLRLLCLVGMAGICAGRAAGQTPFEPPARSRLGVLTGPIPFEPDLLAVDPWLPYYFHGYPAEYLAAEQPIGHEVIWTGPNAYVYRPLYADEEYAAGSVGQAVNDPLTAAFDLFRAGDYEQTLALVERSSASPAARPWAELLRSHALFALGDYHEAAAALERALVLLPREDWGSLVSERDRYYPSPAEYARHLRSLEEFIRQRPTQPGARLLLAYHYVYLGRSLDAVRQLEAAVAIVDGQLGDEPAAPQLRELEDQILDRPALPRRPGPREF